MLETPMDDRIRGIREAPSGQPDDPDVVTVSGSWEPMAFHRIVVLQWRNGIRIIHDQNTQGIQSQCDMMIKGSNHILIMVVTILRRWLDPEGQIIWNMVTWCASGSDANV